ncbi:DUF2625 family protein [Mesorhizobium sp.]|uniref:DUF2625 family protein n=1 Tax=Mesorhizobium sp. TaxID=1871066 RepID=UPI000FE482A9|nr:DUF2625 family protein [Mesorhizobium sp.]RWO22693.1 MAG: DUF2625 family protein [Mesorhizobium sp.]RWP96583.1 MAG: DUF2625 family protein [Mesorhizobium sp.]RWQ44893.1 MAG: DUF2625 family protein [Mesorhizobium sp.]TJV43207.1 MAG: DUF2625 family protein [Mesorhizobium sp.]
MRPLGELIDQHDPGIALVREWSGAEGGNAASILPPDESLRDRTLLRLQVTTRSILGAIAHDSGGVIVAEGRLRILGSGTTRSLIACNEPAGGMRTGAPDDFIVVADDVLGGVYALNGGRFGREGLGEVFYLAADDLIWSCLDVGYSDFVSWCLTGDLDMLYGRFASFRPFTDPPPSLDKVYSFYPFLWTKEASEGSPSERVVGADDGVRVRLELAGFEVQ